MPKDRRHASIMFTDIVGYTALMGSDEDRASEVLGDRVNIASRIRDYAEKGCIMTSRSVYQKIEIKADIHTLFKEGREFKNMDEKIGMYRAFCGAEEIPKNRPHRSTLSRPQSRKPKSSNFIRRIALFGLAGILFLIICPVWAQQYHSSQEAVELEKSIAFLPLRNLNKDEIKEYLADGVMDAITGHLSKIDCLIVRPPSSTERYRNTNNTMQVIGEELGVTYLIEGSFLLIDNQMKLTIQLINVRDENHMFSREYDRDYSDIMAVQGEVAQTIAKEIKVVVSPETNELIETNPTNNLPAYDYYLKGNQFRHRGSEKYGFNMIQMIDKAGEMYAKAVELDPDFVLAWVGLASINRELSWYESKFWLYPTYFKYPIEGYLNKIQPQINKTKNYLDKAIALDPDQMEVRREEGAHYIQCSIDFSKAVQVLKNLHADYPNDGQTVKWIAHALRRIGEYEESFEYYKKAKSINPTDWTLWQETGRSLEYLRRYDEAEKYYDRAALLNPSSGRFSASLFLLYCNRGKIKEAKEYLEVHKDILNESRLRQFNIDLFRHEGDIKGSIREIKKIPYDSSISKNSFFIHKELGWKYIHSRQKEKQKEHFQKVKDIFESMPSDTLKGLNMYSNYAVALAGVGMMKQALDTINKVLEVANIVDRDRAPLMLINWRKTVILTLINDSDALFDQLNYILNRYGGMINLEQFKCSSSQTKCDPLWRQFHEMERFQEIINNPDYQEIPLEN